MIKIIEAIKDYAMGKYFDFITEREMNQKDPHYFGKISDEIADELYDFFNDLIAGEKYIRYDFTAADELKKYEDIITGKVLNPDIKIVSLYNTFAIFSALTKITKQSMSILFDTPCGFENDYGSFKIGLNSFANDVTTGFPSANTVNLSIISGANETVSMFAIDSDLIDNEINCLIGKYIGDKNIKKLNKKLKALQQTEINENT